ncbi:MAG TPA: sigma 54-interacting transcriptional regulator [Polyangiaceae bacterium]|jgi:DNA-binding NtrC family response regulator
MSDDTRTSVMRGAADDRAPPARFVLRVVSGANVGATFVIDGSQPRMLLGQGPACVIHIPDPEVSRRHLALEPTDAGVRITDLGSTNGTFVDRVRVIDAELFGEELIRVGGTVLRLDREEDAGREPPASTSFGKLVGASPEMRRLYPLCQRLAESNVPVIIEGETGTGKEVLAESIVALGPRAGNPFVVFDCTAVPPNLAESELFGHERGAFTGALAARRGVFEQAHGGTLLIDEIGDLDLALQPKLLRAIERGEVRRVGGDRWIHVDVRLIAATRRDLDREIIEGRFRDDLFHRLAVARIELPPLRRRTGDVTLLARHIWEQLGGEQRLLPESLLAQWDAEPWPGNVRELRNTVARHFALGDLADIAKQEAIARAMEPAEAPMQDAIERLLGLGLPFPRARDELLAEFERRYVARLLEAHGGDVARAAEASGIGLRYFQKLRQRSH